MHVFEVLGVRSRLNAGMQHLAYGATEERLDAIVPLARRRFTPLLELDQDGRLAPRRRAAEHEGIESRGTERQLHLEHDAVIADSRVTQLIGERTERVAPRGEFRDGRPKTVVVVKRVAEPLRYLLLNRLVDKCLARARK